MVLGVVLMQLKAALLFVVNLIKRSLCCFRRSRKSSVDSVPLTGIGIVPSFQPSQELENWNAWDEGGPPGERTPQTVQEHIEYYRRSQQVARSNSLRKSESDAEPQADFFQDMEPEIRRQAKILLKTETSAVDMTSSRLAFVPDVSMDGPELGTWEEKESKNSSWAEAEEWDGILREKRREEHKKRLMEKEHRKALGARVS